MERFLIIFLVLATLSHFAQKEFLQILIYSVIAIEFVIMAVKELRKRVTLIKQGQE